MSAEEGWLEKFSREVREGHDEQKKKIAQDTDSVAKKIVDGAVEGVTDAFVSPFSWLKNLLK